MKKLLVIKADTNDGDYVTSITEVDDLDILKFTPIFNAIKNFKPYKADEKFDWKYPHTHNWPVGEYVRDDLGEKSPEKIYGLTEEQVEEFQDYCPYGEHGIHTIESITVLEVASETDYL